MLRALPGLLLACVLATGAAFAAPRDVTVVAQDGTTQQGTKWALVIGCDGYERVPRLKSAVKDAKRLADSLVRDGRLRLRERAAAHGRGAHHRRHDTLRVAPSTPSCGATGRVHQGSCPDRCAAVFFAGHGFRSRRLQRDYLAPLDVEPEDLEGTGIAVGELLGALQDSGARQATLIVDACRNQAGRALAGDGMSNEGVEAAGRARGVWYLASCSVGEVSREDETGGFYTTYLLEALRAQQTAPPAGAQTGWSPSPRPVHTWSGSSGHALGPIRPSRRRARVHATSVAARWCSRCPGRPDHHVDDSTDRRGLP